MLKLMSVIIPNKFSNDPINDLPGSNGYFDKQPTRYENNNIPRCDSFYLQQDEKQNKPTFLFWTLVVFLLVLAVGNLILTFIILGVLRLGQGMESLEMVSEENLIKFYGTTDLDMIYKRDGHIEGFGDDPLEIIGDAQSAILRLNHEGALASSIDVGTDGETVYTDSYEVRSPDTGSAIFSTDYPNFGLPRGVVDLHVDKVQTKRISSPVDKKLSVHSDQFIDLYGTEGTRMDGKEVVWSADQDIFLKSVNKSVILSSMDGVFVDVKRIPIANIVTDSSTPTQYKICVCMPSGKLFRVPVVYGREESASCYLGGVAASQHPCID